MPTNTCRHLIINTSKLLKAGIAGQETHFHCALKRVSKADTKIINEAFQKHTLISIASEYDRSDAEFVSAFKDKYSNPLPASWMIMEITSFGSLSMLYKNLKGSKEKREIAHYFGLADTVFQTWLHSIVYLRNVCAHHSRLWNRNMSIQPEMPKTPHKQWLQYTNISTKKTYFILCMINYLLQTVNPKNTFKNRFRDMIEDYPNIDVKAMGFPIDWDKESLWKIQEKGLSRPEKSFTYVSPKN